MSAFRATRYLDGPWAGLADYFGRPDTPDGITDQPIPGEMQALLREAINQGVMVPNNPTGQQWAARVGASWSPPAPAPVQAAPAPQTAPAWSGPLTGPLGLPSGLNQLTNFADVVFGPVPGTPANQQPTVQLRQLLLDALRADEAARIARTQSEAAIRQGDQQLAQQYQLASQQLELQVRQLEQQSVQFAASHGLQAVEQQYRRELASQQFIESQRQFNSQLGENARQFNTTAGQNQQQIDAQIRQKDSDLARLELERQDAIRNNDENRRVQVEAQMRQLQFDREQLAAQIGLSYDQLDETARQFDVTHGFEREKFTADLASRPEDLVESAIFQGGRTAGGVTPLAPLAVGGAGGLLAQDERAMAGGAGSILDRRVPVAATTVALQGRTFVPRAGATQASGLLTTLGDLRSSPDLRLRAGNMDLASTRNVLERRQDSGFLQSALKAQGQNFDNFKEDVKLAGTGQRRTSLLLQP